MAAIDGTDKELVRIDASGGSELGPGGDIISEEQHLL